MKKDFSHLLGTGSTPVIATNKSHYYINDFFLFLPYEYEKNC